MSTIHPISIVEDAIAEYRDHVRTEFRARDPELRQRLEEALDQPRFLAQEPFFQAHRAFLQGERWRDLGLDADLAKAVQARAKDEHAWFHQSQAITHLLAPDARPLTVTTGTGSGKTECFLLPVIHNAIQDSVQFKESGLTAILVYPMNALANDQEERIRDYLEASGHGHVSVGRYDRSTKEDERQKMRANPPHILLTNYMMLEYLLVRLADREALFANHRCRFVVLDEVHTYRGALGANIGLLFRRLRAHLDAARQDFQVQDRANRQRFPRLVPVATSATIKSVDETGRTPEEVRRLRDEAVQQFFAKLTGVEPSNIRVIGEALADVKPPAEARWGAKPVTAEPPDHRDAKAVQAAMALIAGLPASTPVEKSARGAAILWKLGELLSRRPLSLERIAGEIMASVSERKDADLVEIRREVELALVTGAALPDDTPGALRLRTHRFFRGGWRFHRCIDPTCGKLWPMGETQCGVCLRPAAPLYLCRSCGADALGFSGDQQPDADVLSAGRVDGKEEWYLYDAVRLGLRTNPSGVIQMGGRPVVDGFFDPASGQFLTQSADPSWLDVALAPDLSRCLVCGSRAGSHDVVTKVSLGTSAAVRVLCEGLVESLAVENAGRVGHDNKERLLVFADSRQDAAHQARFISYAGRFDRMRRNVVRLLQDKGGELALPKTALELLNAGLQDNPVLEGIARAKRIAEELRKKATAWEEAPLLEDVSIGSGYRATILNLGLVGVRYDQLDGMLADDAMQLAQRLGLTLPQLGHAARCVLDVMRERGAVAETLLRYHPVSTKCPDEVRAADWERKLKQPTGFACDSAGQPTGQVQPQGPRDVAATGFWRAPGIGGMGPATQRRFQKLVRGMSRIDPTQQDLLDLLSIFRKNGLLKKSELFGSRDSVTLLQINPDNLILALVAPGERRRCEKCRLRLAWAPLGAPCPRCTGTFELWPEAEVESSRYVKRIRRETFQPLVAREHTAQVPSDERIEIEDEFKGSAERSPVNVLSCSPTLEMGIDVGGLDAVVMRNVPPRPDNYAQRGGRAGRRTRVGVVLGYARATPHDAYFYDRPAEMIAGEVPAPLLALSNRDVVLRHLNAIALGLSDPGLRGQMLAYVSVEGQPQKKEIDDFITGFEAASPKAVDLALSAWGPEILKPLKLDNRDALLAALQQQAAKMRGVFASVALQVAKLRETITYWAQQGSGDKKAVKTMDLIRRLLGMRSDQDKTGDPQADDRSAGHPLRRFAEFGLFPGYEFPSEPSTLRLLGEYHEEEPISVERRFGLAQYCPEAVVHARGHRWKVVGLDPASPWNSRAGAADWTYVLCSDCGLRYQAQEVRCPRCESTKQNKASGLPAFAFGGFLAVRDDTPVLQEEDRFAASNLLRCYPQWNGVVTGRFELASGWPMVLSHDEEVRWLNEWKEPTAPEIARGDPTLHGDARGFYLCPSCGRMLDPAPAAQAQQGQRAAQQRGQGRRRARTAAGADPFGHVSTCERRGQPPVPLALVAETKASTLRIQVELPLDYPDDAYVVWGQSIGQALRIGMRHLYLLEGREVEFELEPLWETGADGARHKLGTLTFVDGAVGGSGFLERAADEMHVVAQHALEHLKHEGCTSACYRCLKSYQNQRYHDRLNWPSIVPHLEILAAEAPKRRPAHKGDSHDPKPWLEAFNAGVGSPLELKFLRLFEQHGLQLEKQVPISLQDGAPPITVADFAAPQRKLAIYVDSAAFHVGGVRRRDLAIRNDLTNAGWRVEVLRANDLGSGAKLVARLGG